MELGQFQIYTGDGKGKTTAAIGLAIRAAGAGMQVYIGQFIKDMEYHEVKILKSIPQITVELYGTGKGCLIGKTPMQEDIAAAKKGIEKARKALEQQKYNVVILDEINVAWQLGLVTEEEMLLLTETRPCGTELVFTGRGCPQAVLERADLVSEVKEVKHYYRTKKLLARDGIEC